MLCGAGTIALLALILARTIGESSVHRRVEARRELLRLLIGDPAQCRPIRGMRSEVAKELTIELAELMCGPERERMLLGARAMGVPKRLVRQLRASSPQDRLLAAETLALFDEFTGEVESSLDDRNATVRLGAALALAHSTRPPDPAALVRKLHIGTKEHSLLLVSLMNDLALSAPKCVEAMIFDRSLPVEARLAATDALANSGERYAPLLALMARDASCEPALQPRLYRALGRTQHPEGAIAIGEGLYSEDWRVRTSAAEAAGKALLISASERLGELLSDDNWWVRLRAGEALLRLGPRGIQVLWSTSQGGDERARTAAHMIMAEGKAA